MAAQQKSRRRIWIWAGVLAVAAGVVLLLRLRGPEVVVVGAEHKDLLRTVVASGRVLAPAEVKVGSLVSGTVAEVLAREGQDVQAGDVLLRLDDASARAEERQAVAALAEARAGRRSIRALDVPAATQQLEQARARLDLERKLSERALALLGKQALAPSEVELAQTNLRLAESQVRAAELQLAAVSTGGSGADRAAAATAAAEAVLDRARVELSRTQITAAASGVVLARFVEPGDLVSPGTQLYTLSTKGQTRIVIEPDERSLAVVALGQTARVSTEAFPEDSFQARVSYIAPAVNARRGTIEVRLDVPEPPPYLKPDMTVSTEVLVGEEKQALVVPTHAVRDRLGEPWLFVVADERVERRAVQLGVSDTERMQVKSGLRPGELVVVDAAPNLEPGQRVRHRGVTRP